MSTPEDKLRVGASAHVTLDQGVLDLEITESLENEKIIYLGKGAWDGTVTSILEPVEEGTKLTYVTDAEFRSILLKILSKLFKGVGEKDMERSLENLKSILEK